MSNSRWSRLELDITPDMISGVEEYNDALVTRDFIDDRGVFWNQETGDDYVPSLRSGLQVQWTYSKICNFSCNHCFNHSGPDFKGFEADPFLIAENLCSSPPYNVCMCGGEPMTWKPLYDVIEKLRKGGVPLVSSVSNGYLSSPERMQRMYDAGLTNMQISIDGLNSEQFMLLRNKADGFEKACRAVDHALKFDWQDLSVSFTPTRKSIGSWKEFCHFWAERGVTHIRTQPFMPIGQGTEALSLMPTDEQYLQFQLDTMDLEGELPGCFVDWGDPLEHIWFYTKTPSNPWNYGIQTDGWYELSCYIPVLLGSALEHSIDEFWALKPKELWNSPIMKRFSNQLGYMKGMSELDVEIYAEESLHIDIFDPEQYEIFMTTDDLSILRGLSERNMKNYLERWSN